MPRREGLLLQSVNTHYPSCPSKSDEESATLATLVDMYSNATTWTSQRQILSAIVVDKNFQSVKEVKVLYINHNLISYSTIFIPSSFISKI